MLAISFDNNATSFSISGRIVPRTLLPSNVLIISFTPQLRSTSANYNTTYKIIHHHEYHQVFVCSSLRYCCCYARELLCCAENGHVCIMLPESFCDTPVPLSHLAPFSSQVICSSCNWLGILRGSGRTRMLLKYRWDSNVFWSSVHDTIAKRQFHP